MWQRFAVLFLLRNIECIFAQSNSINETSTLLVKEGKNVASLAAQKGNVAECPGEGDRYGDHKCSHDDTHRVCAQLLGDNNEPLKWGSGDFWEITGQPSWKDDIVANHGKDWCICMWATAKLIQSVGCDNVHIDCGATDVEYVMKQYEDGGHNLEPAKKCLAEKCQKKGTSASSFIDHSQKVARIVRHDGKTLRFEDDNP